MQRILVITAVMMLSGPVLAADLWCMPDRVCKRDQCKPTQNTETSVRLSGADTSHPVLRSDGEDVPMRLVGDGAKVEWQGRARSGATERLVWTRADGSFVYQRRSDAADYSATGRCEVQ